MLSNYINSCESIRKAVGPVSTRVSAAVVCTKRDNNTTCASVIRSITSSYTKRKTIHINKTSGYIIKRCRSAKFTFCTRNNDNTTCISLGATMCETTVVKCSFQEFCEKVKNTTCKVFEEIKEECNSECNNICVGSDDKCKKFINVTMEYCKKEATSLIVQLNKDLSPESVNPIILRFIGLQLYMRVIQEFCLLRDNFTKIIDDLTTCYDVIKSCNCGNAITGCCSTKGKCLCTIFYKLFQAIKLLHDRYCKIIGYMNGESDEDLYKVIPSLSLTRSIIIITKYFNEYIKSGYMVEEDKCNCATQAAGTRTQQVQTTNEECTCHKYSSKLDDVVTLLLGGIEDTDDCDGLLSDVISMMSPIVKDEDYRSVTIKTDTSENIAKTNRDAIESELKEVNQKKDGLKTVITGINGGSKCGGTTASSSATCTVCSGHTQTTSEDQAATRCNGTIATDCNTYTGNGVTNGCGDGATRCNCNCEACKKGKAGECCCFYKDDNCDCEKADKNSIECLRKMVEKLNADRINCNGDTNADCLMSYLCVLKNSICGLKTACTVTNGGTGVNLHETLKNLPDNISAVVGNICGDKTTHCCKKCTTAGNGCSDEGTCTCSNGNCCQVNDRYSNFTKFLLGTDSCSTSTSNNCKTITKTLIALNNTLGTFITENGASGASSQCKCTNGDNGCTNKCCCALTTCTNCQCKENKPIKILSCVVECGLKGIQMRSEKIVNHIESIVTCLECIQTRMSNLEKCYCTLHENICELGKCVKDETTCIKEKIDKLKTAKEGNQGTFNTVIEKSKSVLSDICGLYRVYYMESYSYYLSPYYIPISPIINNSSFHP